MRASLEKRLKSASNYVSDNNGLSVGHGLIDGSYIWTSFLYYLYDCDSSHPGNSIAACFDITNPELFALNLIGSFSMMAFAVTAEYSKVRHLSQEKRHHRMEEEQPLLPHNDDTIVDSYLPNISQTAGDQWFILLEWLYPYLRDTLSALKNGRHALLNPLMLTRRQAYGIFNPYAIALGVSLVPVLVAIRKINENRKQQSKNNVALLYQLECKKKIDWQSKNFSVTQYTALNEKRNLALVIVDGLTDGSYLYGNLILFLLLIGISAPTAGVPAIIGLAAVFSMALASCVVKFMEEKTRQREFNIVAIQLKIDKLTAVNSENEINTLKKSLKEMIIEEKGCFLEIIKKEDGKQDARYSHSFYEDLPCSTVRPTYRILYSNNDNPILEINTGSGYHRNNDLNAYFTNKKFTDFSSKECLSEMERIISRYQNTRGRFNAYRYYSFRAFLSGIKNFDAARRSTEYFFQGLISGLVCTVIGMTMMAAYSLYLTSREILKGRKTGTSPYSFYRVPELETFETGHVNTQEPQIP